MLRQQGTDVAEMLQLADAVMNWSAGSVNTLNMMVKLICRPFIPSEGCGLYVTCMFEKNFLEWRASFLCRWAVNGLHVMTSLGTIMLQTSTSSPWRCHVRKRGVDI